MSFWDIPPQLTTSPEHASARELIDVIRNSATVSSVCLRNLVENSTELTVCLEADVLEAMNDVDSDQEERIIMALHNLDELHGVLEL